MFRISESPTSDWLAAVLMYLSSAIFVWMLEPPTQLAARKDSFSACLRDGAAIFRTKVYQSVIRPAWTRAARSCTISVSKWGCFRMREILVFALVVTLIGFPIVHVSAAQAHHDFHHEDSDVDDSADHHAGAQPCDMAEGESSTTHSVCCPILSGHCNSSADMTGLTRLDSSSVHSSAAWPISPGEMPGLTLPPETPPPRT